MSGFFDFFGFGSRRRTAIQVLDKALDDNEVNRAYIDDGMRFAIYKWAEDAAGPGGTPDYILKDAATLISFCVLGKAETAELWGDAVAAEREARFDAVLANDEDDSFDARLIKLVLAKGNAAEDIRARVDLESVNLESVSLDDA